MTISRTGLYLVTFSAIFFGVAFGMRVGRIQERNANQNKLDQCQKVVMGE